MTRFGGVVKVIWGRRSSEEEGVFFFKEGRIDFSRLNYIAPMSYWLI